MTYRCDGDLSTTASASRPLHSFQFTASAGRGDKSPSVELTTAMDLSVGGEGLIGRRVQLVDLEEGRGVAGPKVLREGILGWN